ncbi:5683_t:CDS:1, partial [Cetraspora pellucida]
IHAHSTTDLSLVNQYDIVVPNYNFSDKVHNEDFHYTRLIAGFVQENDNLCLPISIYDPNLEPLLFSDLFTNKKGHFHDILNLSLATNKAQ